MTFSVQGLAPITTTKKSTAPTELWEHHVLLVPDESHIMHNDFSVRTITSDFKYQTLEYKITVFQMKSGFFSRNPGLQAIEVIANMVAFLSSRLKEAGLDKVFGVDYSLFDQKYHSKTKGSDGKDVSLYLKGYKNVEFYIMPLVPIEEENGVVVHKPRLFSRALIEDRIKPVTAQPQQTATQQTQQASGWGSVAQTQPEPKPQATLPESWGAK